MPDTGAPHNLPYPGLLDAPNGPAQIQALAEAVNARLLAGVVTTLPGSPVDGQRCLFLADAATGAIWDLRYRSASTSPYKWEMAGGSSLHAQINTNESTFDANDYDDLTTVGPSITLPRAGEYDFEMSARLGYSGSGSGAWGGSVYLTIGGVTDGATEMTRSVEAPTGDEFVTLSRTVRKAATAAGSVAKLQYMANTPFTGADFGNRVLRARPVRIG